MIFPLGQLILKHVPNVNVSFFSPPAPHKMAFFKIDDHGYCTTKGCIMCDHKAFRYYRLHTVEENP